MSESKSNPKSSSEEETQKKTCFIIMPISDVPGYDNGHFFRVYNYIIKPACERAGYNPVRSDDIAKPNIIMVEILQQILGSEMAICDMSSRNANVFYELGFRQAFNKKTVLIKDNKTEMPFDTSSMRTQTYDASLRIDSVNDAVDKLTATLEAAKKSDPTELSSFLKLLGTERAVLPEGYKISDDSALILKAINELSNKMQINGRTEKKQENAIFPLPYYLPKGMIEPGDNVVLNMPTGAVLLKFLGLSASSFGPIFKHSDGGTMEFPPGFIDDKIEMIDTRLVASNKSSSR